ncbi:MAG: DUF1501 domain-containing protein [Alphaproteobacteria bacterium]|nr:DUF1501 domain-containing protein [Alphaproteobacteria bacterium]
MTTNRPANVRSRRAVLKAALATGALSALPRVGAAAPDPLAGRRLVLVFLRGGLDGLALAPAYGDPAYAAARRHLALPPPGSGEGALELDATFALHPALHALHPWYGAGELALLHAVASPHRGRSHFEAQDLVENGTPQPYGAADGWLNRALGAVDAPGRRLGLALGHSVPLLLRGPTPVMTWAPSHFPRVDTEFLARLADLYEGDALLAPALADALKGQALADEVMGGDARGMGGRGGLRNLQAFKTASKAAGELMAAPDGPRVAVLELSGWDSHANQGTTQGQIAALLGGVGDGLASLKAALGPAWRSTAVLVITEFGRMVAPNGTGGTDHGTAGAALLAGGAVKGGRVIADWPGLGPAQLFEGRDLRPTLELRPVFKALLRDHLKIAEAAIETRTFPESRDLRPLEGLFRA